MASENKVLFYSEELNQDIYQNNDLLESKKMLAKKIEKDNINKNSYNTIVDSIDYLGCINGNCSKIHCDCGGNNEKCECKNNNLVNNSVNSENNNVNSKNNNVNSVDSFIKNLIDFIFILLLVSLLVYVIYKKESFYLLHILGLTLVYIFYKIYIDSRL